MDLYFLRHAKAVARVGRAVQRDPERPLTPEGAEKMGTLAKGMQNLGLTFDLVLTSPSLRALQTAELTVKTLKLTNKLVTSPHLAPDGDPKALLAELRQQQQTVGSVLLVGHEPYLSGLLSILAAGTAGLRLNLKKGGLAKLTTDALRHGHCATLEWVLAPRHLVLLAKV